MISAVWGPVSLLGLFISTHYARTFSSFPHSYAHPPAYWQPATSLWIILSLALASALGPALCYCMAGRAGRFVAGHLLTALIIGALIFMALHGGYGVWGEAVTIRDPAPWVPDKTITARQTRGLTTGCFQGNGARNPDRLEFTIRWWSDTGEVAQYDLAGFQLKAANLPSWLAAVYPYYLQLPRQTLAARVRDPTTPACVSRLSHGLSASQADELRALLGLGPDG